MAALAGCGGSPSSPADDVESCETLYAEADALFGSSTATGEGSLAAVVDGEAWSADELICVAYTPSDLQSGRQVLHLFGFDARVPGLAGSQFAEFLDLVVTWPPGVMIEPGSYSVLGEGVEFAFFDAATGFGAEASGDPSNVSAGADGSINLTSFTSTRVAGTFSFTAVRTDCANCATVTVTGGFFDLVY